MNRAKLTEPGGKIRYSITARLNSKLFFRLLGLIISLNIIILLISGVILTLYCENKIISAIDMLSEREPPDDGTWLELSGMSVRSLSEHTVNNTITWPFTELLPYDTQKTFRGFHAVEGGFRNTIRSIAYIVNIDTDSKIFEIKLYIGPFILYLIYAFAVLFVFELLTLLSRSLKDRQMIRRTLDPITELARTAQSLNNVNKQLDHENMLALAGRLDGIDAGRLDTRIQIDDLQEELKNVAVAINGMLDRINASYAAQARFVSDASHELRTPIAVIQGYANLLDRWGKDDEKALTESVSAIKDEAGNMKDLVEQLLFLARGDSNRIKLTEEYIEMTPLIEEVADEMRMLYNDHVFNISGSDAAAMADRSLIKQALRILVDNAVKYTDPGGEINISAHRDDGSVRLSVSDNGIGINPNVLPYVLDRFVRADESRARATGGAGLGLSIAQWIIARHNGHMEILSREGIGTRITIVLPFAGHQVDMPPTEQLPELI